MADKCYSADEENFSFDSAEEAVESMDDPQPGDLIYEGEVVQRKAGHYLPRIDSLLEQMGERAWDDVGEHAPEDWPGAELNDAKAKELEQLLRDWMDANVPVRFWSVANVKQIELTAEMIAAARGESVSPPQEKSSDVSSPSLGVSTDGEGQSSGGSDA